MTMNNTRPLLSNVEEIIGYLGRQKSLSEEELACERAFSEGYERACDDIMLVLKGDLELKPQFLEAMKQHLKYRPMKSAA
jgi:hypothetical protein